MFAVDASGSIGSSNFRKVLNFVADVTTHYDINKISGTQVGIVRFASSASRIISLPQYQSNADLKNAILRIRYTGGGTATHSAIQAARNEFKANGRSSAHKVLVIVTDGKSNSFSSTTSQAKLARDEGMKIFAIGIGSGINLNELREVASDPDSKHVLTGDYTSQSFARLSQFLSNICKGESEMVQRN